MPLLDRINCRIVKRNENMLRHGGGGGGRVAPITISVLVVELSISRCCCNWGTSVAAPMFGHLNSLSVGRTPLFFIANLGHQVMMSI